MLQLSLIQVVEKDPSVLLRQAKLLASIVVTNSCGSAARWLAKATLLTGLLQLTAVTKLMKTTSVTSKDYNPSAVELMSPCPDKQKLHVRWLEVHNVDSWFR